MRRALSTVMSVAATEMEEAGTLVVVRPSPAEVMAQAAAGQIARETGQAPRVYTIVELTPLGIAQYPGKTADEALREYSLSILDRLVLDLHHGTRH